MAEQDVVVWVDRGALDLQTMVGRALELRTQPEAGTAIGHLLDAGCRVVLLGPDGSWEGDAATYAGVELAEALPDDADGWLVTADEARCGVARGHRRLRTILVGPSTPDRGLAHRPYDREARDLLDAALVILASDAMPEPAMTTAS
jgi:hypothetical protein